MSTYFVQGSTMDAIADAINAKTGGSSAMTPAQMVTAIGAISGGGGTLPSSISKIDGGVFTPASTANGAYQINHSLGEAPKGYVIWTEEIDLATAGNNAIIRGVFIVDKSVNSTTSFLYQMTVNNQNFNNYARSIGASYSGYANASYISYNVTNVFYSANKQYKWIAWA